jgi:hypothetical protein
LTALNPTTDLPEGSQIAPNSYSTGAVLFAPSLALSPINSDPRIVNGTWTLNNDDPNFGIHIVNFTGTVIVPQHGPLDSAGNSIFKYLGCYLDSANGGPRLFPQTIDNGANNENGLCQKQASAGGAVFAGTEYHTQCWWGNEIPNITFYYPEVDDKCSWVCPADGTQPCGGNGGYISVFYDSTKYDPSTGICTGCSTPVTPVGGGGGGGAPAPVTGVIEHTVGLYNYVGCYTEATNGRALSSASYAYDSMTPDTCAANCTGYPYFGVEYGRECYCGNILGLGSNVSSYGDAACNMPCAGNSTELCGAASLLTMYALNGTIPPIVTEPAIKQVIGSFSYYQCQTEATTERALSAFSTSSNSMTLEMCISTCAGYTYAGAEYGRECYCGNAFNAGSVVSPGGNADCDMACSGNPLEFCGAATLLSVYILNETTVSSSSLTSVSTSSTSLAASVGSSILSTSATSSSTSATSSSTSATSSSTSATSSSTSATSSSTSATPSSTAPSYVKAVGSYNWIGCYTEATNTRALNSATLINYNTMTVEMCANFCGPTYSMFGVEYSGECYCGDVLEEGSVLTATTDCWMTCDGNPQELCGGPTRLDVYQQGVTSAISSVGNSDSIETSTTSTTSTTASTSSASAFSSSTLTTTSTSAHSSTLTSSSSTSTTASTSSTSAFSSSTSTTASTSSTSAFSSSTSTTASTSYTSTFSSSTSTTSTPAATYTGPPVISQGNVNFTYLGCLGEPTIGRALPYIIESNAIAMTVERCLEECWMYQFAGVEWSQE